MNWIKDKVSTKGSNGAPDQGNFMVGSNNWLGNTSGQPTPVAPAGSFKNPESANLAVQNAQQPIQKNPYLYTEALSPDSLSRAMDSTSISTPGEKKSMYPQVQGSEDEVVNGSATPSERSKSLYPDVVLPPASDGEEVEILTGEQLLVTIPGAIVHLIDQDESVLLGSGDFQLIRFVQEKTRVVVIAKVGEEVKWPLVQEMPTVKLDPTHYYFSINVPRDLDSQPESSQKQPTEGDASQMQTLNYGLTFPAPASDDQMARLGEVDNFLQRYSTFSAPTVVQKDGSKSEKDLDEAQLRQAQDPNFAGMVVPAETLANDNKVVSEETSAAFWTTMAPNVDDYNSKAAKGIAAGAGHVIRGILWLSDTTVQQLDSGHVYMKNTFKPKKDPSKIGPHTISNVRRVRRLTGMTDRVAKGVLGGIVYTTGLFSSAVINSPPGKAFFKLLPGEVALVSLDAFSRVFDAVEKGGKDVMSRSSEVTEDFVRYRYGEAAKELTEEVNKTAGHVSSTVWTFTKIRKAFNPKNFVSKTSVLKAAAQQVAVSKQP